MKSYFSLHEPSLKKKELENAINCIKTGWLSSSGKYVGLFEKSISDFNKARNVLVCNSGTAALHIALKLAGVKKDDEVIVPTITFIATVNSVLYNNASPIFMDCDEYLNIDVIKVLDYLKKKTYIKNGFTYNKRTKKRISAILVTHVFGNLVDLEKIIDECILRKITIIEDASEALGCYYLKGNLKNLHAGTISNYGVLSFNVNKIITTGGGGALILKKKSDKEKAKKLCNQSKIDDIFFLHNDLGFNYGMQNINAGIGLGQIKRLNTILRLKKNIHEEYSKLFFYNEKIKIIHPPHYTKSNYWLNLIAVNTKNYSEFKKKILKLIKSGISVRPVWKPCHLQSYLKKYETYKMELSNKLYKKILCVPSSYNLKLNEIRIIAKKIIDEFN